MSALRNKNICLIDEVDTIIIGQENVGRLKSTGEYIISDDIVDGRKIARISSKYEDNTQARNLYITDANNRILLEGVYFKRNCQINDLNIYSPAGFHLGTVKERHCKCYTDYEILSANQQVIFLVRHVNNAYDHRSTITLGTGEEIVAEVNPSPRQQGQLCYTVTYMKNIPVLQKVLILCEVLSYYQQEPGSFVSKAASRIRDIVCCTLYYESKIRFYILCLLFPLVIIAYFICIIVFVALVVCLMFSLLFCRCHNDDSYFLCTFTWPCRLCRNYHNCLEYFPFSGNIELTQPKRRFLLLGGALYSTLGILLMIFLWAVQVKNQ